MTLHIHGQPVWHEPAYLVGTEESLRQLAALIQESLEKGNSSADFMCGDGEGYTIQIIVRDEDHMATKAATPYSDKEMAGENRPHVIYPWKEELK